MLRIAILRAEMEFQPKFSIEEPSTETEAAKPSPLGSEDSTRRLGCQGPGKVPADFCSPEI